jgi:hypothetical protein
MAQLDAILFDLDAGVPTARQHEQMVHFLAA